MATIYLTTDRKALLVKLANIIDITEGFDVSVRRPGYVTERWADIDTHPNGTVFAVLFDDTLWKNRIAILDYLDDFGISRATIANKVQRIRDALSTNESVTFSSGLLAGVTLTFVPKGSDWTPAGTP